MPEEFPLIYRGSVKDVYGVEGKDPYIFSFSNRYSIFDWGEMPDALESKGESLAIMGFLFFEFLGKADSWKHWQLSESYPKFWRDSLMSSSLWSQMRKEGMPHHCFSLMDANNQKVSIPYRTNRLAVKSLGRAPVESETVDGKLVWKYDAYKSRPADSLVPLEVVFRFGAPEGSSFLERVNQDPGYAKSLGLADAPKAGDRFPFPVVEFFTKLEPTDRFLSFQEAREVAALSEEEQDDLIAFSQLVAARLKDIFSLLGLGLWDGKFEFAFTPGAGGKRGFMLVDSIGPDELRLIGPGGVHFSKEFLRRVYRNTPWYGALGKAKKLAQDRGQKDWKNICREELKAVPEKLSAEQLRLAEALYPSLVNALAHQWGMAEVFSGQPSLGEVCEQIRRLG